ncbi:MAG: MFS transporter [Proteobacteria bacterium]|nr:MFS transporter [Pseudomonadota bacterium]
MPDPRWVALIALSLGVVMIVLDGTVVTVALPLIRSDLGFSQVALVWLINAYILTYGGCMLLGGRLGDLYGARRVFLTGIVTFTLASLACGLSTSQTALICARAFQGIGGAVVSAVALSLITNMFTETGERAKAIGIYGFIASAGGTLGVLLGGFITSFLNWHWVFLVNIPYGALVFGLCVRLLPQALADRQTPGRLDFGGAVTLTAALMLAVYSIISGGEVGWYSGQSVATYAGVLLLLMVFVLIESRVRNPLMPLGLLRHRPLVVTNITAALAAAAMFSTFFLTLYLQRVLGKSPLQVSLIFLPTCLISAVLALGFSARIVHRYGIRRPFAAGLLAAALGLALLAAIPVQGDVLMDLFPGMTLFTIGAGVAGNPLFLSAMQGVAPKDTGLASGLIGTSSMIGGSLGLAILAASAEAWTRKLLVLGADPMVALIGGYHVAFATGAVLAVVTAGLGLLWLPKAIHASVPASVSVH